MLVKECNEKRLVDSFLGKKKNIFVIGLGKNDILLENLRGIVV